MYKAASDDKFSFAIALSIALCLFIIYNLNFRHGSGVDTIPSTLIPVSILKEGNFNLDEFHSLLTENTIALKAGLIFGSLQERDGHLLGSYPIGGAILATPVFAVALFSGQLDSWHAYRVTAKIASSLMVALSAGFLFLTLRSFLQLKPSIILTLLYGLGTTAWPVVSQDLWQHGPGMLSLSICLYILCLLDKKSTPVLAIIAGTFLGTAIICRYLNAIPGLALSLYMIIHHRRHIVPFAIPIAIIGLSMISYNFATYGQLTGGYSAIYTSQWHGWRGLTPTTTYSNPFIDGFFSILISPSKGLLIYSPYLLFGLVSIFFVCRARTHPLGLYLALWVLLMIAVLSKNVLWWGGTSFGPRYFSEATIALTLLIGMAWSRLQMTKWLPCLLIISGILSIGIQFVGAFYAPCGWAESPSLADTHPERHWDWSDPEILRCINHGIKNGPIPFEILTYKKGDMDF